MQNQTLKVLSTLTSHAVRHLRMGHQTCVLFGAARFNPGGPVSPRRE